MLCHNDTLNLNIIYNKEEGIYSVLFTVDVWLSVSLVQKVAGSVATTIIIAFIINDVTHNTCVTLCCDVFNYFQKKPEDLLSDVAT